MTRMTGPDCVVMCNLINTHTHTHTQNITDTHSRPKSPPQPVCGWCSSVSSTVITLNNTIDTTETINSKY